MILAVRHPICLPNNTNTTKNRFQGETKPTPVPKQNSDAQKISFPHEMQN